MGIWSGVHNEGIILGTVPIPSMFFPTAAGLCLLALSSHPHHFPPTSDPSACALYSVDMVTLATALEIFNEHDLQPSDRAMDVVEVIHCLTSLYERLEEERGILVNVPLCVDMSLNWLLNVFDRYRPRGVPPLLGLLCLGAAKWPRLVRMGLAGVGLPC